VAGAAAEVATEAVWAAAFPVAASVVAASKAAAFPVAWLADSVMVVMVAASLVDSTIVTVVDSMIGTVRLQRYVFRQRQLLRGSTTGAHHAWLATATCSSLQLMDDRRSMAIWNGRPTD
jgi:hypothetical protein